jgi:hypothetical protein
MSIHRPSAIGSLERNSPGTEGMRPEPMSLASVSALQPTKESRQSWPEAGFAGREARRRQALPSREGRDSWGTMGSQRSDEGGRRGKHGFPRHVAADRPDASGGAAVSDYFEQVKAARDWTWRDEWAEPIDGVEDDPADIVEERGQPTSGSRWSPARSTSG